VATSGRGESPALHGTPVPIEQLAFVRVVGAAPKLNVLYRGLAPHAVRVEMMELDEGPLVAASPALAHDWKYTQTGEDQEL